jgi:hypothetical protein
MFLPSYRPKWATLHHDVALPPVAGAGNDIRVYRMAGNMLNKEMRIAGQQ